MFWSIQSIWMEAGTHSHITSANKWKKKKEWVKSLKKYQFVQKCVLSSWFINYREMGCFEAYSLFKWKKEPYGIIPASKNKLKRETVKTVNSSSFKICSFIIYREMGWNVMFWNIQSVWMEARVHHIISASTKQMEKENSEVIAKSICSKLSILQWNCVNLVVLKHTVCWMEAGPKQQTNGREEWNSEIIQN